MCGRYYIAEDDIDEMLATYVAEALARAEHMDVPMRLSGEIRPTDIAPVIATSASRRTVAAYPMRWGFRHPTRGMLVFNTRSETAAEKPLFCTSISDRRCLILTCERSPASKSSRHHRITHFIVSTLMVLDKRHTN